MANILAAAFDDWETADEALKSLQAAGFEASHMNHFYLNAPGQHGQFPIGGDQDADREASGAHKGALVGAAIGGVAGLVVGLAAAPLAGAIAAPAAVAGGTAVGAYTGSLAGAAGSLGDQKSAAERPESRPAGVVVALYAPTESERARGTAIFRQHHARAIEEADGRWEDGTWQDFDPVSIPDWRKPPEH